MVKKRLDNVGEQEAFGMPSSDTPNIIDTEVRFDILLLRQLWSLLYAINSNDLLSYERTVRGLERLIIPFMSEDYENELNVLRQKYKEEWLRTKHSMRNVKESVILNKLLDDRTDLLMKHAKKVGMLPKKIIWD